MAQVQKGGPFKRSGERWSFHSRVLRYSVWVVLYSEGKQSAVKVRRHIGESSSEAKKRFVGARSH
jgi:hypothetical protein